jgi:hypothetical protein
MLPMLVRLKICPGCKGINLWLPLFLIWPIVAGIFILLLPFICLASLILSLAGIGFSFLKAGQALLLLFSSLRGLKVKIRNKQKNFHMEISIV